MKQPPLELQKMEMMGRMSCAVIHDLNNLLTVIQLNAALLEIGGMAPEENQKLVEEITRACGYASDLTKSVLTVARRPDAQQSCFEIGKVISELKPLLEVLIGKKTTLTINLPGKDLWLAGSSVELQQIILNIVTNAMDSDPKDGVCLTVTALEQEEQPGRFINICISDTGRGIPPEELPDIFNAFFTTKAKGQGTGLGLDTVKRIVAELRGWIEVESTVGIGTTFYVSLPQATPADLPTLPMLTPRIDRLQGTILLVEDDPGIRAIGKQILKREGFHILEAGNSEEALKIWEDHRDEIQLLFTDLILPGDISGGQLALQLLADKPSLKVIYTSGNLSSVAGLPTIDEENFLQKPYRPEVLTQHVSRLMAQD